MNTISINSMTGFGRAEHELGHGKFIVEIRGVNHKHSDIRVRLPQGLGFLELPIRNHVKETIGRGRVEVNIKWDTDSEGASLPRLDTRAVEHYLALYKELGQLVGKDQATPDVQQLLDLPGVLTTSSPSLSTEELQPLAMEALDKALQPFLSMRQEEGHNLLAVLQEQLETLQRHVQQVEMRLPDLPQEHYKRLKSKLEQWDLPNGIDEGRLEQELAILAERCDISEEVDRVHSHVRQFDGLLQHGGVIGRRLDFLCQELHREANTMGAKTQDRQVAQTLIALKATIEKLREQVQNLE
ncbi:MAG: YicC family protein [Deltaproteobacteria bacterium]|nr:MAG: YicC family protein [Deltaproteobacteria bacterium]